MARATRRALGSEEQALADMSQYPHVITLNNTDPANELRLHWCTEHVGPMYTDDDKWTYWNEQYIGGSPDNVMYMFSEPKAAILFKLRWMGAQR
jgi:hypothetical protein